MSCDTFMLYAVILTLNVNISHLMADVINAVDVVTVVVRRTLFQQVFAVTSVESMSSVFFPLHHVD
jgi:hypothetical protein